MLLTLPHRQYSSSPAVDVASSIGTLAAFVVAHGASDDEDALAARTNCVSSLLKLVMYRPAVENTAAAASLVVEAIPLRYDLDEAHVAHAMFIQSVPRLLELGVRLVEVLKAVAAVLLGEDDDGDPLCSAVTRTDIPGALSALNQQVPGESWAGAWAALAAEERSALGAGQVRTS